MSTLAKLPGGFRSFQCLFSYPCSPLILSFARLMPKKGPNKRKNNLIYAQKLQGWERGGRGEVGHDWPPLLQASPLRTEGQPHLQKALSEKCSQHYAQGGGREPRTDELSPPSSPPQPHPIPRGCLRPQAAPTPQEGGSPLRARVYLELQDPRGGDQIGPSAHSLWTGESRKPGQSQPQRPSFSSPFHRQCSTEKGKEPE